MKASSLSKQTDLKKQSQFSSVQYSVNWKKTICYKQFGTFAVFFEIQMYSPLLFAPTQSCWLLPRIQSLNGPAAAVK